MPPACADYACVSYVDEHVGAILGTLDRSGLAPETAVIFHADHVRAANQPTDRCHNSWRCDGYTTGQNRLPRAVQGYHLTCSPSQTSSSHLLVLTRVHVPCIVQGYHLGEHGEWEKKSNWDLVVRVPLMIHVPYVPWMSPSLSPR